MFTSRLISPVARSFVGQRSMSAIAGPNQIHVPKGVSEPEKCIYFPLRPLSHSGWVSCVRLVIQWKDCSHRYSQNTRITFFPDTSQIPSLRNMKSLISLSALDPDLHILSSPLLITTPCLLQEKLALAAVMAACWVAVPAWILAHIREYRGMA